MGPDLLTLSYFRRAEARLPKQESSGRERIEVVAREEADVEQVGCGWTLSIAP